MNTIVASRRDSEGAGQTMQHDLTNRGRRSVRLRGYDYTAPGAYFVTICTQDRACMFGEVVDGVMCPNDAGRMVETVWGELPVFYPGVAIDGFVVMPNHIHGIIVLVGAAPVAALIRGWGRHRGLPLPCSRWWTWYTGLKP